MNKEEWKALGKKRLFDDISQEQRKRIIRACSMTIMQQVDKSDSKLRENKERIKEWIFRTETAKKVGLDMAYQEIQLADLVGDYMIDNKDIFIGLPTYAREKKILEEMCEIGIIETAEVDRKSKAESTEKMGTDKNTDLTSAIKTETDKADETIPIEELKQRRGDKKAASKKQTNNVSKQRLGLPEIIDLSKLNNPDLLLTNKKTGQKQIKYGRYSESKRTPYKFSYQGTPIQITRVGRLEYKTSFMLISDIDEYLVQTPDGENEVFTYGLEMEKIESDEQYRRVFFEQLIDGLNMNLFFGNGYIGSIVNTGNEKDKYKIEYSEEEYTAVTELKQRLERMKRRRIAGDRDDR